MWNEIGVLLQSPQPSESIVTDLTPSAFDEQLKSKQKVRDSKKLPIDLLNLLNTNLNSLLSYILYTHSFLF